VEGFIRAFNDEVRDTELMYSVECEFSLRKSSVKGELYIHGEATYRSRDLGCQVVAVAVRVFPSPRVRAMHACLYQAAMALNVAVQKWYRTDTGRYYSSPVEQPVE